MNGFRVMLVFVMYYIYVTSGSSLLIESTDSMIFQKQTRTKHKTLSVPQKHHHKVHLYGSCTTLKQSKCLEFNHCSNIRMHIINSRRMRNRGLQYSWVCVCDCLSGQDKLLRLLTPAGYGAYRLYTTNARFKTYT